MDMLAEKVDKAAHLWARHPDDYYVEPEWCSERLFATEVFTGTIIDPACGSGRIVRAARAARRRTAQNVIDEQSNYTRGRSLRPVYGYDLVKRSNDCVGEEDFLLSDFETDNIVSNPPFKLCSKPRKFAFVRKALDTAVAKVALLMPLNWVTGAEKAAYLQTTPLAKVLIITPRPSMPSGPYIEAGLKPGGGTADFCWCIWEHGHKGPPTLGWLNRDAA